MGNREIEISRTSMEISGMENEECRTEITAMENREWNNV